ncbi:MAG: hypothetical protein R3Y43_02405 [Alphaproteobacteria bacterium]
MKTKTNTQVTKAGFQLLVFLAVIVTIFMGGFLGYSIFFNNTHKDSIILVKNRTSDDFKKISFEDEVFNLDFIGQRNIFFFPIKNRKISFEDNSYTLISKDGYQLNLIGFDYYFDVNSDVEEYKDFILKYSEMNLSSLSYEDLDGHIKSIVLRDIRKSFSEMSAPKGIFGKKAEDALVLMLFEEMNSMYKDLPLNVSFLRFFRDPYLTYRDDSLTKAISLVVEEEVNKLDNLDVDDLEKVLKEELGSIGVDVKSISLEEK